MRPQNVVVSAHLDFLSRARFDDPISSDARTREIRLRHKSENRIIAVGYTTHCALDDDFKPVKVPDPFRSVIRKFEGS